jgi:hypothetical protein
MTGLPHPQLPPLGVNGDLDAAGPAFAAPDVEDVNSASQASQVIGASEVGGVGEVGEVGPRPVPVFRRVSMVIDQARRQEMTRIVEDPPLGEADLVITGWNVMTQDRLTYRPESDQEFPWRDPGDPLNRVYAPYSDSEGRLDPAVTVRAVRIGPIQAVLRQMARDLHDPRLSFTGQDWPAIRQSLEHEVSELVRASTQGRHMPPRIQARILSADDVLPHEQVLVGQYGAFLTEQALAAQGTDRPLASHGHVLALYPAAVLDQADTQQHWHDAHPNFPAYAVDIPRRGGGRSLMSAEGYAGTSAFINTRLTHGAEPPAIDQRPTGVNALLVPFEVQLTLPPHPHNASPTRWQPLIAVIALDNLYADHNPAGMVLLDYGDAYLSLLTPPSPTIKPDPS